MEKLCGAFFFSKNGSSKKNTEIAFSEKTSEESLKNWKLPPFSASDFYKPSGIFSSSIVKTVEDEISLSEGYATFPLFSDNLKRVYQKKFHKLHFGMIQVGLKPTKLGSNASAILCLRDKRHLDFGRSVLGMVESSLCDGPIYFSYFPPNEHDLQVIICGSQSPFVRLSEDLSSSFSIDIKTEGCSGGENIILMYRLHYKVVNERCDPRKTNLISLYRVDKEGITTLFLTDVAKTNRAWPKKISWYDEVAIPERWAGWRETAKEHLLQLDVGKELKKEEVKLSIEAGRILQIRGERSNNDGKKWSVKDRVECLFLRRFRVPENAKLEEVTAVMENPKLKANGMTENGVLLVTVPKAELEEKAVQILVE